MNCNSQITGESCWNNIGVWGKSAARCPKLTEFVHCRNCPTFIAAGRDLLNREVPAGYIGEWTKFFAEAAADSGGAVISVIVFRLGNELLALRSAVFKEIVSSRPIHQIPHRSNAVLLGVTNIHGILQLCFSLKALAGIADAEIPVEAAAKMLVIAGGGDYWVFPVDQVLGIFQCKEEDFKNVPATIAKAAGTYTKAVIVCSGNEAGLLDDELLIYSLRRKIS
jgi:chemotaxis-related protein WspD